MISDLRLTLPQTEKGDLGVEEIPEDISTIPPEGLRGGVTARKTQVGLRNHRNQRPAALQASLTCYPLCHVFDKNKFSLSPQLPS